jgi:nicotinate dehydrogenase subunit A
MASRYEDCGVKLRVNDVEHEVDVDGDIPLIFVLRNDLGLVGTRFGCGLDQCGVCNVLVDGRVMPACSTPAWAVENRSVTTIDATASPVLERLRDAFVAEQAGQCGYCLSGIVITAAALLATNPSPAEQEVREALDGNLCRCGTHNRIVRAVLRAAGQS